MMNELVDKKIEDCIKDETEDINSELSVVEGHFKVREKKTQIHERLIDIVNSDEEITKINDKLKKVVKSSFPDVKLD